MNIKTYIGVTIGPIVKTIENAKETGELWGSSYIFSYMMKKIIGDLIKNEDRKKRFIVPYVEDKTIFGKTNEVGIFHDRFIFESNKEKNDFEEVCRAIKDAKSDFAKDLIKELKNTDVKVDEEKIKDYVEDFFKIYTVEVKVDLCKENIIKKVSNCLDALELREKFVSKESSNYISIILRNRYIRESFLAKDAYGETENGEIKKGKYPSLIKIAMSEFNLSDKYNSNEEIKKYIQSGKFKNRDKLKKYNEYVALVQVDGDSIGKVISNLKEHEDYKKFSHKLLKYSQDSHKIIKEYGGFTIYAGGDDLLFIAPIVNINSENKCKNIFQLFDSLSEEFHNNFKEYIEKDVRPTISIGAAVVHNKFPLYFALEEARNLLFNKAKHFKDGDNEKNAVAFKVIKNSGESFESVLGKESDLYKNFKKMFNLVYEEERHDDEKKSLNQIHIKVLQDKVLLSQIICNKEMIENYFNNNFNEEIHKKDEMKKFIRTVIDFVSSNCNTQENNNREYNDMEKEYDINSIYACLKLIRFMNEKSELGQASKKGENDGKILSEVKTNR